MYSVGSSTRNQVAVQYIKMKKKRIIKISLEILYKKVFLNKLKSEFLQKSP